MAEASAPQLGGFQTPLLLCPRWHSHGIPAWGSSLGTEMEGE